MKEEDKTEETKDKTEAEEAEKVVAKVNKGETKERPKAEGEY